MNDSIDGSVRPYEFGQCILLVSVDYFIDHGRQIMRIAHQ